LALVLPAFALLVEGGAVVLQALFERSAFLREQFPLALDRMLPLFDELADSRQLPVAEQVLLLRLVESRAADLLLAAEFGVNDLELLHRLPQVFLLKPMAIVEQNPLLLELQPQLLLLGKEILMPNLELVTAPDLQLVELLAIPFAVDDELFALGIQRVPFAQERLVELLELGFELEARLGPLGERRLLALDSELALLQAGFEVGREHPHLATFLVELGQLRVQPLLAAIQLGVLLAKVRGDLRRLERVGTAAVRQELRPALGGRCCDVSTG